MYPPLLRKQSPMNSSSSQFQASRQIFTSKTTFKNLCPGRGIKSQHLYMHRDVSTQWELLLPGVRARSKGRTEKKPTGAQSIDPSVPLFNWKPPRGNRAEGGFRSGPTGSVSLSPSIGHINHIANDAAPLFIYSPSFSPSLFSPLFLYSGIVFRPRAARYSSRVGGSATPRCWIIPVDPLYSMKRSKPYGGRTPTFFILEERNI